MRGGGLTYSEEMSRIVNCETHEIQNNFDELNGTRDEKRHSYEWKKFHITR